MNPVLVLLLLSALPPSAQAPAQTSPVQDPQQVTVQKGESNRSVLKPAPGQEAIKEKDLYDRTGYLHLDSS